MSSRDHSILCQEEGCHGHLKTHPVLPSHCTECGMETMAVAEDWQKKYAGKYRALREFGEKLRQNPPKLNALATELEKVEAEVREVEGEMEAASQDHRQIQNRLQQLRDLAKQAQYDALEAEVRNLRKRLVFLKKNVNLNDAFIQRYVPVNEYAPRILHISQLTNERFALETVNYSEKPEVVFYFASHRPPANTNSAEFFLVADHLVVPASGESKHWTLTLPLSRFQFGRPFYYSVGVWHQRHREGIKVRYRQTSRKITFPRP